MRRSVGLSPPLAFGLVWRVLAGCNQSLLPTAASRRYLRQSVLGCWIPYPGGTPCARACFFHGAIGLPQRKMGRLPAAIPLETTSCGGGLSRLQIFRYVPASKFAYPPDRPSAANTPAGQPGLLRPSRTRFVASPRIGYANRPKTGNWRCGDLHPARLRPCRLLLSFPPTSFADHSETVSPCRLCKAMMPLWTCGGDRNDRSPSTLSRSNPVHGPIAPF